MFRTKVRIHTCRIILLTSLVWFLVDILLLTLFSDCIGGSGWNCISDKEKNLPLQASSESENIKEDQGLTYEKLLDRGRKKRSYALTELRRWMPAKPVPENYGSPGEMGRAVRIDLEEERKMKEMFKINQFNLLASDRISLNRSLQEVRAEGCKNKKYQELLPSTSIVIVFHNEAWSTLLRTVWSVINRSPKPLLKEIILVDDASEQKHLGTKLENYVEKLPVPVRIFRTPKRSGLIRARLLGAKNVRGQIITFLDAHCECAEGWLEPLLSRITEDRRTVVCPIIDVISDDTFEYITASDMTWGGFNWRLNFRWYRVPQREVDRRKGDKTAPIRTPTMAGGLFSIDKEYFYELGAYDEGMDIWGGENLEMSFRVWQCGGILEIVPCSHVGHVFRDKSPYTFPGGVSKIVLHNANRVAEVWMDEWRDFYYAMNPGLDFRQRLGKWSLLPMYIFLSPGRGGESNSQQYLSACKSVSREYSFKMKECINENVWMCGGSLEIIPCSRVGHVFRKITPYSFPGGVAKIVYNNNARLAEVWLDEWKIFYYSINPGAKNVQVGDITERLELRKKLQCKSFRWYLTNIYPESTMPLDYYFLGDIKNLESGQCLDTLGRKSGENLGMSYCHNLGGNQVFSYTKNQQVIADDNCLDAASTKGPVKLIRCHGIPGNQSWMYYNETLELKHMQTGYCLEKASDRDPALPLLRPCNGSRAQKWIMSGHFKWQSHNKIS